MTVRLLGVVASVLVLLLLSAGCTRVENPVAPVAVQVPVPADQNNPVAGDATDNARTHLETFVLRAYDLDSVHIAGSLNDWNMADPEWEMTLQEDGYTWLLEKEVPDYLMLYKFIIREGGRTEWLSDPAAVEVTPDGFHADPAYWNGVRGRPIAAPTPLPTTIQRNRLIIYEMSLNDFSTAGTFAGAIAGLTSGPNLFSLGVNAVELMPVSCPSYNGWGYDPVYYFAPNPNFGTTSTFANLVDSAHQLGIAVILDVVPNHMAGSNPLRQLDEFTGTNHFTTAEPNPWGLLELNWTDPALRDFMLDALCHWVDTYSVDGFRFDYIGGEPYSTWVWIRDELKSRYPDLLLIAEDFTYPNQGNAVTHGFDAQWGGNHTDNWGGGGNNFLQVMTTALTQRGFAWRGQTTPEVGAWGISYNNMWAVANVVSGNSQYGGAVPGDGFSDVKYLESHDENRTVWAVDSYGSADAQSVGGLTKAHLGAVVSMTSIGIPMLYNGQEHGASEYRPADPVIHKIDWDAGDPTLRATYRSLIELRLYRDALQSEHIYFHWRPGNIDQVEATMVYWRSASASAAAADFVVALNFDHLDHTWNIPFPAAGNWVRHHLTTGGVELVEVSGDGLTLTIPASTAVLWSRGDGISAVD